MAKLGTDPEPDDPEPTENILALRCIEQSREWDNFWKQRANEHAARNDTLNLTA